MTTRNEVLAPATLVLVAFADFNCTDLLLKVILMLCGFVMIVAAHSSFCGSINVKGLVAEDAAHLKLNGSLCKQTLTQSTLLFPSTQSFLRQPWLTEWIMGVTCARASDRRACEPHSLLCRLLWPATWPLNRPRWLGWLLSDCVIQLTIKLNVFKLHTTPKLSGGFAYANSTGAQRRSCTTVLKTEHKIYYATQTQQFVSISFNHKLSLLIRMQKGRFLLSGDLFFSLISFA